MSGQPHDTTTSGTSIGAGPDICRHVGETGMSSSTGASQTTQGCDIPRHGGETGNSSSTTQSHVADGREQVCDYSGSAGGMSVQYADTKTALGRGHIIFSPSGGCTGGLVGHYKDQRTVPGRGHSSSLPLNENTHGLPGHHTDQRTALGRGHSSSLPPSLSIHLSASVTAGSNTDIINTQPQPVAKSYEREDVEENVLCQGFSNLGIDNTGHHEAHQHDDNGQQVSLTKEDHAVSRDSHALLPQVHSDVCEKQNAPPQSSETGAVGGVQKEERVLETDVNTVTQRSRSNNSETVYVQGKPLLARQNSREIQLDLPKKISLYFSVYTTDSLGISRQMFPEKIDVAKWHLLEKCGKLEDLKMITETENRYVGCFLKNVADESVTLVNTRRMQTDEAGAWITKCFYVVYNWLQNIESVAFIGADVSSFEKCVKTVQSAELHYIVDSDRKQLLVFSIKPEEMDKVLKITTPLFYDSVGLEMLIKIIFPLEKLQMLERLGFREHCKHLMPGLKMLLNVEDHEYVLVCRTDLRKFVHTQVQVFLDRQARTVLNVHDFRKKLLFDARDAFVEKTKRRRLHCWWRENQGSVELLSPTDEMLSKAKEVLTKSIVDVQFRPETIPIWNFCRSALAGHPHCFKLFHFRESADCFEVTGVRDVIADLEKHIPVLFDVKKQAPVLRTVSTNKLQTTQEKIESSVKEAREEKRTDSSDSLTKQEGVANAPSPRERESFGGVNHRTPPPTAQLSDQTSSSLQRESEGRDKPMQTENVGSDGACKNVKFCVPAEVASLLEVSSVLNMFKAKLMDKECIVRFDSMPEGFIKITQGRLEDVSSTFHELFHCDFIEAGENDMDLVKGMKSLCEKFPDKISYIFAKGQWNICVTADIKDETHDELEKLKKFVTFVRLPLYAYDFIALKIESINREVKKSVHSSVDVCVDDNELPGAEISADRGVIGPAVEWLHKYILLLEAAEKAIDVEDALFFQDLDGQEWSHKTEENLSCRIDTVVGKCCSGLYATAPSGQQLVVCGDAIAATECDCIVLPLWDGQTEWSFLQRLILSRSLLSDNIVAYQSLSHKGPVRLQCNADYEGKILILVSVPAEWNSGTSKEKERIMDAYQAAFALCGEDQRSVAVCVRQSPKIPLRKSLTPLLYAIFGTSKASSTACNTVVIYTDKYQDGMMTYQAVEDGLPKGWSIRPQRVPRSRSGNGTIKVQVGEIQNTQVDVIVNTTNWKLVPEGGAVERVIAEAAGKEMIEACRTQYPKGIPTNGLAVTESYNMKNAKKIYHIALSHEQFEERNPRLLHDLGQVILHCLLQASLDGHHSIAFPTLGSGKLKYPCEDVAKVMFSTINYFFREMPFTSLRIVVIVVYSQNFDAIQALKMEEISQLYRFSSEEGGTPTIFETWTSWRTHKIQILHGNPFSKPWVSDVCVHGELASQRGESPSDDGGSPPCRSVVVRSDKTTKDGYKICLKEAFKHGQTVQIAAQTLRSDSMEDLASALESVLWQERNNARKLVTLIFSKEEMVADFPKFFRDLKDWHFRMDDERENGGLIAVCSFKGGEDVHRAIMNLQVPGQYKKMMKLYRTATADQTQNQTEAGREDKESDLCTITVPSRLLENTDVTDILGDTDVKKESSMNRISVKFENLQTVVTALCETIGSRSASAQAEESKKTLSSDPESTSTWSRDVDEFEISALRFLLGEAFDQSFDVKESNGCWRVTMKGASFKALENQVDLLRREDVQLTAEEVSKLGDTVDVRSEGIEAFVKVMPSHDKATVFALEYGALSKAKHLVTIKAGRVKVTSRARRKFDAGTSGQQDQTPPPSLTGPSHTTKADFTTQSGIKVCIYKTDITKLPVDAIVNAANERLCHGGGVAAAISRAAGFVLEDEGREHIRKNGELKVMEVIETSGGMLPSPKVLHAVGPRWDRYTDKRLCQDHLVSTVFNCLLKANTLGCRSIALPSISAAIFGVPQQVCAESYLSAVKKFDEFHGATLSLRDIHFVDVSDSMISIIQNTFSAQWKSSGSSGGSQDVQSTAADTQPNVGSAGRQEGSAGPVRSLTEGSGKPLDMQPQSQTSPGAAVHDQTPRSETRWNDLLGFPCFSVTGAGKEYHAQIDFRDLNLTLVFQNQSVAVISTEAVILWHESGNPLKDSNWRQFQKIFSAQAENKILELKKKNMTAEGKIVSCQTMNKHFVFPFLSSNDSYSKEKMRDFVEQALNKVDLESKKTVAIPRRQRGEDWIHK